MKIFNYKKILNNQKIKKISSYQKKKINKKISKTFINIKKYLKNIIKF